MPDRTPTDPVICPSCAASVRGRFCPRCGTLAREMPCAVCGAVVAPGERFCGDCGVPVGAPAGAAPGAGGGMVPLAREEWRPSTGWKVGVGALVALLLVTLYLRFGGERPPATPPGSAAPAGAAPGGPSASVLSMPPQQQADALFDRVMRLSEEGKRDSVQFFAPMAMSVYERLQPLDHDQRFDLGTIALAAGDTRMARAQADTILRADADHLLGLALLSRTARAAGAAADAERADARFRQAADGELKRTEKLEYQRHRVDIETELKRLAGMAQ